jgi:cyclomaltodextrinase
MIEIRTPDWVKHAVFYQIFPDRFAQSARVPKPNNLEPWDVTPTYNGYKGGDLLGIVEHLDHLQDLGINAIYLTPIFQSATNHRYHTHDYYQVDPILGGNSALRELIDAAHQRNMKVVLDGVFNHASRGFFFFHNILENGPDSPWLDWFIVEDWPLNPYDGSKPANYVAWVGNRALPKLNTDNLHVREYLMRVAEYWLHEGIDGWRLDVPFEIKTEGFWQEFRQRVKAINPEAYIVGEVWRDSRQWLQGDQFDGVMNYLFTAAVIAFTAGGRVIPDLVRDRSYDPIPAITAEEFATKIDWLLGLYAWEIQLTQLNLLDSHDTARLLNIADGDKASVHLATILLFTFPGAPSIFYGDEIGLPGGQDPDCRRAFPWEQPERWDQDVLAYHKALIALRHAHPALRTGSFRRLYASSGLYAFARRNDAETLVIAVNTAEETQRGEAPWSAFGQANDQLSFTTVYGHGEALCNDSSFSIAVPPRDSLILLATN